LKKLNLKLRTPLERRLDLESSWSLKNPILKMETTMRRALNIALVDRNTLAQSLWEITMSGRMIMRKSPLIITTRKQAKDPGQKYQLLFQPVPM
jgi:hypothetical protein